MNILDIIKIGIVCGVALLAGCASYPRCINDVCAVFDQRDGLFDNWRSGARRASAKYGVPVPVLMATVRMESGFKHNARPPRRKVLGIFPGPHISSAYGYSQALDRTWNHYKKETGRFAARRTNFSGAVDFVGWYHARSAEKLGIARNDTYRLYLAYYLGWKGYSRGGWSNGIDRYARQTDGMARRYATQLVNCP
ncbi:MAG: hypothetical protein KF874_04485 [Rhizobiaceae bacterium]|nr:hypothetical protein [Rhizobiaceae bacterium]